MISKIETKPRIVQQTIARPQTQTQAQFKKYPQLQILQKPSNDHKIPPPLLIDDQNPDDNTLSIKKYINNIDNTSVQTATVPIPQNQIPQDDQENSQVSKYQDFSKFLINELNRRYDLRPRAGPRRPPKNPVIIETQIKSVETQTKTIQPLNQPIDTTSIDKIILTFNVEKELERVKIPIPLSELSKNPGYKNQVTKWIQNSSVDVEGDVISLQDEKPSVVFGPSSDMIHETMPPFNVSLKEHDSLL